MRNDLIDITVLLDRSGSMASCKADMEGGFQTFLDSQKTQPGETRISLHQFDTQYESVYVNRSVREAPGLALHPRGGTALFDSMKRCIDETGARLAAMPEHERPAKVLFVVITDGEENSSLSTTREQLAALVKQQQEQWKWEFIYLGANQDAFAHAVSIGVPLSNAGNFTPTSGSIRAAYASLSTATNSYRATGQVDLPDDATSGRMVQGQSGVWMPQPTPITPPKAVDIYDLQPHVVIGHPNAPLPAKAIDVTDLLKDQQPQP